MRPIVLDKINGKAVRLCFNSLRNDDLHESRSSYLDSLSLFINESESEEIIWAEFGYYYFEIAIKEFLTPLKWKRIFSHKYLVFSPRNSFMEPYIEPTTKVKLMEFPSIVEALEYWNNKVVKPKNYQLEYY